MKFVFIVMVAFSWLAYGATASSRKPAEATAVVAAGDKMDASVRELLEILLIDKKIQESVNSVNQFFEVKIDPKKKDAAKMIAIKAKAKKKYDQIKAGMQKQVSDAMVSDFKKKFSEAEIKYLIDVVKFPVFKRLSQILSSDEFQDTLNLPSTKVSEFMKEAGKDVAAQAQKKTTK